MKGEIRVKVKGITTIDYEINFGECQIDDVPEKIKKLFPNQNLVKVTEKGKKLHPEHRLYCLTFYESVKEQNQRWILF